MKKYQPVVCKPRINLSSLLFSLSILTTSISVADTLIHQQGHLEYYLKTIDYGSENDGIWKVPDTDYLTTFGNVYEYFISGDYEQAQQLGNTIGYQVIKFTDLASSPAQTHYILQEFQAITSPDYMGAGIYVTRPSGDSVVIEAPHPQSDLYTELQAIELYLKSSARFLAIAGARRNSVDTITEYSGNYYASDAVHNTQHTYFVAHERSNQLMPETIFVQLHGFGASTLSTLQSQCGTGNDALINLSEGLQYKSKPKHKLHTTHFIDLLANQVNIGGMMQVCLYGYDTTHLGGITNTTGRLTNDSSDPSLINAKKSSHQFIHIEQSFPVRSIHRKTINASIRKTIALYFQ